MQTRSNLIRCSVLCIDVIKNPAKSIAAAKKKKDMNRTLKILLEVSIIFAVASGILVARAGFYDMLLLVSAFTVLTTVLIAALVLGLVIHVAASTLGGRGKYYEGLTAVVYSLSPVSAGFLASAVLALLPFSTGVQLIVLAVSFAMGMGIIYRSIKELYSIDMITSLVVVSISILAIVMAVYGSVGISFLGNVSYLSAFGVNA